MALPELQVGGAGDLKVRYTTPFAATPHRRYWLLRITTATIRMNSTSSVTLTQLHGREPAIWPVTPLTTTW